MNKVEGLAGAIYATVTGTGEEVFHALPENRKDRWLLDAKRVLEWLSKYEDQVTSPNLAVEKGEAK